MGWTGWLGVVEVMCGLGGLPSIARLVPRLDRRDLPDTVAPALCTLFVGYTWTLWGFTGHPYSPGILWAAVVFPVWLFARAERLRRRPTAQLTPRQRTIVARTPPFADRFTHPIRTVRRDLGSIRDMPETMREAKRLREGAGEGE